MKGADKCTFPTVGAGWPARPYDADGDGSITIVDSMEVAARWEYV